MSTVDTTEIMLRGSWSDIDLLVGEATYTDARADASSLARLPLWNKQVPAILVAETQMLEAGFQEMARVGGVEVESTLVLHLQYFCPWGILSRKTCC